MPTDCISFKDTNYFSKLICDYLEEKESLSSFYNHFPKLENFSLQIEEKAKNYKQANRKILVDTLQAQYRELTTTKATQQNIELLKQDTTYTVTTGHQLNLFTGPLYFLYKIISTINLTKTLKNTYPNSDFVPVYWMATEDHDFDEINYFKFQGKKVQWNRESKGAVGRLTTEELDKVCDVFMSQLPKSDLAKTIKELFTKAYIEHQNLTDATRYLANALFGDLGLVIIDADDKNLKQLFQPFIKDELLHHTSKNQVLEVNNKLEKLDYKVQVNPREINLFYMKDDLRERIVKQDGIYKVYATNIEFSSEEIITESNQFPERFSPNVIMRPLYQEVILPNLCYIGGGGELAYWLQLKSYFNSVGVTFPMLLLRNSVLLITKKQKQKLQKLDLSFKDIFQPQNTLLKNYTSKLSPIQIDFSTQKQFLQKQFKDLYEIAKQTDKSFLGAVSAQERKQIKGLEHLEKRLLKAQKRNFSSQLERVVELQNQLFPQQSLQERNTNFSEFYLEHGDQLIQQLVLNLQPLKGEFLILELQ